MDSQRTSVACASTRLCANIRLFFVKTFLYSKGATISKKSVFPLTMDTFQEEMNRNCF